MTVQARRDSPCAPRLATVGRCRHRVSGSNELSGGATLKPKVRPIYAAKRLMRTLLFLLILVNCSGAEVRRGILVATPTPTLLAAPTPMSDEDAAFWRSYFSATPTPSPEIQVTKSLPDPSWGFPVILLLGILIFIGIRNLPSREGYRVAHQEAPRPAPAVQQPLRPFSEEPIKPPELAQKNVEPIEANWDNIILSEATKEKLKTYCELLTHHQWYSSQGIPIPKGLLFYGPPGTGKTETARFLSKKAGFSFVSLTSADLKVGWIGQAAVAIQNAFKAAREKAPSVVYIDEIDASCPTRQSGHTTCIDAEVNGQLLQELDGMKTDDSRPVFVFASTNRRDMIDPAILQRFTEHIEITLPSLEERIQLLRLFIKIPFDTPQGTVSSPYPTGWENAMREDRIGYRWNIENGWSGNGMAECVIGREITPESARIQEFLRKEGSDPGTAQKVLFGQYEHFTKNAIPYYMSEAKAKYWQALEGEGHILERLALATEGQSGRELKNMVTRATMSAVRRSCEGGIRRRVTLKESDFQV